MSYGLVIAADAEADLKRLDFLMQEEVLDELERVLAEPSLLSAPSDDNYLAHRFSRTSHGLVHAVTVIIARNDLTKTLIVLGIHHLQTPSQP